MLNKDEVYVCHMGTDVLCVGTKEECQDYKDSKPFRTDCYKISSLEDYGSACYTDGRDAGYYEGYESGMDVGGC